MSDTVLAVLSGIRTVQEMVSAFDDEDRCRRLLEAMVWQNGRICPAMQLRSAFQAATGREIRRTAAGGISITSAVASFEQPHYRDASPNP